MYMWYIHTYVLVRVCGTYVALADHCVKSMCEYPGYVRTSIRFCYHTCNCYSDLSIKYLAIHWFSYNASLELVYFLIFF